MKNKDILSVLSMIDPDELLNEKSGKSKPNFKKIIKIASFAACFCLVIGAGILFLPKAMSNPPDITPETSDNSDISTPDTPPETSGNSGTLTPEYSEQMWCDTRERNDKTLLSTENGVVWPWNCRAVYDRFTSMLYSGGEFISRVSNSGKGIPQDMIGEKLGEAVCSGYDVYEDTEHKLACEVYEISGVDSSRFVAVKYAGYDEYYPFIKNEYAPLKTFGELVSALNLSENISLREFYYDKGAVDSERYGLSPHGSETLWNTIIESSSNAVCLEMYEESYNERLIAFSLNSDALGAHNLSLSFNRQGYMITNIENYGYYYYIGTDAVNSIAELAMSQKTQPPIELKFSLAGTVSEIGENYIKIDDSVLMKNPDDGIEFTVYATHMNIKRYIISGFLKVGETVTVEYSDMLTPENHTEIKNATNMYEAIITDSGEVLIPE